MSGFEFTWITVVMVALAGFFGAGAVAMWKQEVKVGSGIVAALALACLVIAFVSGLPGPTAT